MRVAIFASGNGTNFEVLAKQFQDQTIPGDLVLMFCDHPDAKVVERAHRFKVPVETFTVKECGGKQAYEERILKVLQDYQIDFIALAGYMRVVGPTILDHYDHRIVNLHPAWLPEYPGLHSIERAFAGHRDQTGVTVHYIDAGLDSGPIIAQRHVPILADDTLDSLESRVHEVEHQLYPQVLKAVLTDLTKKEQG
ncbi:phosphoribosylglycinamide formyltransferase [Limosilactobacillus gastricus]|uniref:Phosphoribosylglycinamide formyltransferase n=1 Tax=Limosilactobacillus gastricus DSM 16045 TaxID=1423749 RepID=A0A0R1VE23_9LACO|nr:phosphoribosylglycinamide formyltransferase [Limosilactobacillus gastricus]KRM02379.1 phosphoribosylglycinamide formyltransferase [Limosilactobacillus gastricus DSM 16045]QGF39752.1 phosphoribosylglycinamide formyltransferase [Limosilactobacillus gastricus]